MRRQQMNNTQLPHHAVWVPRLRNGGAREESFRTRSEAARFARVGARSSALARPLYTTLLDGVQAVHEVSDDEQVVVGTVAHLVNMHLVRLTGTFKYPALVR